MFTADLQAIRTTLAALIRNWSSTFVICKYSHCAVHSIYVAFYRHPKTLDIYRWLSMLQDRGTLVTFIWGPSYCGIEENKREDTAARAIIFFSNTPPVAWSSHDYWPWKETWNQSWPNVK